jgi:hypothetical protein
MADEQQVRLAGISAEYYTRLERGNARYAASATVPAPLSVDLRRACPVASMPVQPPGPRVTVLRSVPGSAPMREIGGSGSLGG